MSNTGKDSLLGNKIAAGVLVAGLLFWGANRVADVVVPDDAPKHPAIKLTGLATNAAPAAVAASLVSIIPLIGSADVAKGMAFVQQQCAACHTLNQGGAAGVGPNLYGVLGGPMFSGAGYAYSAAVKAKAKGNWNYDNMNAWLADPATFAPGTAMSYPGIKNDSTRADAVAYLRTLAARPLPLPTPAEIKAASAPAAPAPAPTAGATPGTAAPAPSIDTMFKTADIAKGQGVVAQQCAACHSVAKGGAAGVGPDLYGIVGAKMFAQAGFSYSAAAKSKAAGNWTADTLGDWLADPNGFAPGTAMSYAGLKNIQTRADVIAYLNKNSDAPTKLPGT
jgi:cytochrome c